MFGIGLNIRPRVSGGYTPTDSDAIAYISAAGYTDNSLKQIIDNYFIALKALNSGATYSKISLMKLYITDSTNNATSLSQCGINAVNPATYVPTFVNNPTANYSGITYNGTTQYSELNFNPNSVASFGLNDSTMISYNGIDNLVGALMFGQRNTAISLNGIQLTTLNSSGTLINHNDNSLVNQSFSGTNSQGFISSTRRTNNNTRYINRNSIAEFTQTGIPAVANPNISIVEGARRLNVGVVDAYQNIRPQFLLFSSNMTTSEVSSIQSLVNSLQGSLDTLFGLTGTAARKRY